jgi:TonB-dependent siderophore receptor
MMGRLATEGKEGHGGLMQLDTRLHAVIAALALALSTPASGAQEETRKPESSSDPSPEQEPPISVEEYVYVEGSLPYVPKSNTIVTKLPLDRRSTPNNVGVVTEPLATEQFDRILGEALVNVSNVNVQTQNGVTDFFYIRGFDSLSSSLVLTDGAPEPEATFYQLYNVELVEVLKGPGGFLYGSNPLAGAVNLVRKQPLPASLFGFSAYAGSYDRYEGSLDWNYGNTEDVAAFRINALLRDEGSYRDGKEGRTAAVNPTLRFRLGERGRLNLNFEYLDLDYVPDAGIPVVGGEPAPVDPSTSYQSSIDDSQQEIFRFQADYEWRFSDRVSLRDKFYQRSLDWYSSATLLSGVIPTGPASLGVIRTLATLDDRQNFTGNQLEAVFAFQTGSVRHDLLAGFELTRFADDYTLDAGLLSPVDAFDPVDPGTAPIPLPDQSAAGDARSIVAAPYVIDQIRVGEGLDLLLGGRLDGIDFQDDVSGASRDDTEFSPMAGALYSIRPDLSVYGNFSRAFAPPSPRVVGELVPERSTQVEAGVKKRFEAWKAETTFAVYQLERENIPIPDDNGFTQQTGNQRSRGFEVDVAAQPKPSLRAFFSYAYNDAELTSFTETVFVSLFPPQIAVLDRSGNNPAFAPAHLMNLWVSKDFSSARWGIGGGARFLGSQFIAEDNVAELDSVLTFDATAFYRIGDVRLRVNLKNITDREYYLRGFGGSSVIPAPPFTAYFGIDYRM